MDEKADELIRECLDIASPRSFILHAGAGSGKTRSLVNALEYACNEFRFNFRSKGQKIGVVTYTNAACDEICERLDFNPLITVETIHAFSWSLIKGFDADIKVWLSENLNREIAELEDKESRGRSGKASDDRRRSIENKRMRLERLPKVRKFVYSPTGDNKGRDALNHTEVIMMTAHFLDSNLALAPLLVSKFPILLIDECQDTNRHLMEALLKVQVTFNDRFCLGLFGDSMQQIYNDGKTDLYSSIPSNWQKPTKLMNYRCPSRVVSLINEIRKPVDALQQVQPKNKHAGNVRLFLATPKNESGKLLIESKVATKMGDLTKDTEWSKPEKVKTLILEHHMAAQRFGFSDFFSPLYKVDRITTSLLQGTLSGFTFFSNQVIPMLDALESRDDFKLMSIIKKYSPLFTKDRLAGAERNQLDLLKTIEEAVREIERLIDHDRDPPLIDVLNEIAKSELFEIPDSLYPFVRDHYRESILNDANASEPEERDSDELGAWDEALAASLSQVKKYNAYVHGISHFDTHQGVKGREFPRVLVILSDEESRGFLFKYDKLLGTKQESKTDIENRMSGKDTSNVRTLRLFYVICSRAEESLAVLCYNAAPEVARREVLRQKWFLEDEIEIL